MPYTSIVHIHTFVNLPDWMTCACVCVCVAVHWSISSWNCSIRLIRRAYFQLRSKIWSMSSNNMQCTHSLALPSVVAVNFSKRFYEHLLINHTIWVRCVCVCVQWLIEVQFIRYGCKTIGHLKLDTSLHCWLPLPFILRQSPFCTSNLIATTKPTECMHCHCKKGNSKSFFALAHLLFAAINWFIFTFQILKQKSMFTKKK